MKLCIILHFNSFVINYWYNYSMNTDSLLSKVWSLYYHSNFYFYGRFFSYKLQYLPILRKDIDC